MNLKNNFPEPPRPQATGRYIVKFAPPIEAARAQTLIADKTGIRTLDLRETGDAPLPAPDADAPEGGLVVDRFKVAIIHPQ